jgi:hypothetical protein
MDLSPWEPTPFVLLEFALTRTFAKTTPKITAVVRKTLAEPTVKRTVLARLVPLLLIVVPSMEVKLRTNLLASPMVLADLVKSMPIALLLLLTVEVMEVAMLVLLDPLETNVDLSMVVNVLTNKTAILSPTSALTSVPLMKIVPMIVSLTVTWNEVAVWNVLLILTALLTTGEELKLEELSAVPIPLASSHSPARLILTVLPELLLALWPRKSA